MSSSTVVKYGAAILVASGLAIIVKLGFIARFKIPQDGMFPSLPAGSSFFLNRRAYTKAADVKRGDVVAFDWTKGGEDYRYVWRVVAVPGESVELSSQALVVDGRTLERTFLRKVDEIPVFLEKNGNVTYEVAIGTCKAGTPPISIKLPPEHFFVAADNRCDAEDSRVLGPIPFSAILGKKI